MIRRLTTASPTRRLLGIAAAGAAALLCLPAQAQTDAADYPTRNVTILVGFPPGTATDTVARILAGCAVASAIMGTAASVRVARAARTAIAECGSSRYSDSPNTVAMVAQVCASSTL